MGTGRWGAIRLPGVNDVVVRRGPNRAWVNEAIRRVEADNNRSADTHLPLAEKIDQITFYGGRCHFIDDPSTIDAFLGT